MLTRDQNCKRSDNSWANGFVFNTASAALTLTNGSATVTGTGLTSGLCYGIASGSVSVTSESASFTGTGLVNGSKIVITGTRGGQPFTGAYQFTQSGGASGSLSALWPGDTGTATYVIENNGNMSAIGVNNDDTSSQRTGHVPGTVQRS